MQPTEILAYYDGVEVFAGQDLEGSHYVGSLIDTIDSVDQYIVTEVSLERLRKFRSGLLDLRSLFLEAPGGEWFITRVEGEPEQSLVLEPQSESLASTDLLPEEGFLLEQLGSVKLIAGRGKSGRTTFAVGIMKSLYALGHPAFHNGTAMFGRIIEPEELMNKPDAFPSDSVILIEEADTHAATKKRVNNEDDENLDIAIDKLLERKCLILLTTVSGREQFIAKELLARTDEHIETEMDVDSMSLGAIHKSGPLLLPETSVKYDEEYLRDAMLLSNFTRGKRSDSETERSGRDTQLSRENSNLMVSQDQSEIHPDKYPAYPVIYRYQFMRTPLYRVTKEEILHSIWLESVNKYRDEEMALGLAARAVQSWGMDFKLLESKLGGGFPDGTAELEGETINLEVTKIQPRFPSGATATSLISLTQEGRAPLPTDKPIIRCLECKSTKEVDLDSVMDLPDHDQTHKWVVVYPGSFPKSVYDTPLSALPFLEITRENLVEEARKAVQAKSEIISKDGQGRSNWLILVAQGFPVEPSWFDRIQDITADNIDAIVLVACDEYLWAFHNARPWRIVHTALVKCPIQDAAHNCYHPSVTDEQTVFGEDQQDQAEAGASMKELGIRQFGTHYQELAPQIRLQLKTLDGTILDDRIVRPEKEDQA